MRAMITALCLAMIGNPVLAKPPLRDVPQIDGTILGVGIADEIRKNCPSISARMLRALTVVNGLKGTARALGYTEAEIDAYRSSDTEKARLKRARQAYLSQGGVRAGAPDTYCALGRAEIEKGGQIGALLRVN